MDSDALNAKPKPKQRGPKPKPRDELKRNSITFRAMADLRADLMGAAAPNGRSLSEEIEARLKQSLRDENTLAMIFGNEQVAALMLTLSATIKAVQSQTGSRFVDDLHTHAASLIGMAKVLRLYADRRGDLEDEEFLAANALGNEAFKTAVELVNPLLRQEFFDEPEIDQTWVDLSLSDPTKARSALRPRKSATKVKA